MLFLDCVLGLCPSRIGDSFVGSSFSALAAGCKAVPPGKTFLTVAAATVAAIFDAPDVPLAAIVVDDYVPVRVTAAGATTNAGFGFAATIVDDILLGLLLSKIIRYNIITTAISAVLALGHGFLLIECCLFFSFNSGKLNLDPIDAPDKCNSHLSKNHHIKTSCLKYRIDSLYLPHCQDLTVLLAHPIFNLAMISGTYMNPLKVFYIFVAL